MSLRRFLSVLLASAVVVCLPSLLSAQSRDYPKAEIFGGYSWYHPGATVSTPIPDPSYTVSDFDKGWGTQFTYNLNHWLGLTIDASGHYIDGQEGGSVHTMTAGPKFSLRRGHFVPFAEALFGDAHISPNAAPDEDSFAVLAGGGLDYKVTPRFSIRPIQVDYVYTTYPALYEDSYKLTNSLTANGVRLQAGLVFNFGLPREEAAVSATCSATPSAVDAGAPVTITVTPEGFLPKRILSYSYTTTGGKISGNTATATVDTTGLAAGSYTVSARVTDNGRGKHQRTAGCEATFAVNAMHPPTLTVSANPSSLTCGETSAITADGMSPDNRPLTYACSSTAGQLSGSGQHYTLETTGLSASTITVNCTVTDDRNLSASASTDVTCTVPPAPVVVPQATKFGSTLCNRDMRRPARVCNEAKAELDRYADALTAAPDSKGVVVGYATADETAKDPMLAAQRAVNTKDYLTREKGIDPSRIEPRAGSGDDQRVDLWIVPSGATFSESDTTVVDESAVKAVPREEHREMRERMPHHHHRHHKKAETAG